MKTYVPGIAQNVSFGSTSVASNAFGPATNIIRLVASTDCYVKTGNSPVADTTASMLLKANTPEYFHATPGQKIAAIQSSASGTLNVTEMVL